MPGEEKFSCLGILLVSRGEGCLRVCRVAGGEVNNRCAVSNLFFELCTVCQAHLLDWY